MKYTKPLAALVLIASAGLSLTACGSSSSAVSNPTESSTRTPETPPTAEPIVSETPTPEPDDATRSDRGNLIAGFGDTGSLKDIITDTVTTKFTVHSIKPTVCTEPYVQPAENGNIFAVDITIETTKALAKSSMKEFYLSAGNSFKFIAANGTTFNGNLGGIGTYSCLPDDKTLPSSIGPAEKVRGLVLLDLPAKHGILVMDPSMSGEGFEYKF